MRFTQLLMKWTLKRDLDSEPMLVHMLYAFQKADYYYYYWFEMTFLVLLWHQYSSVSSLKV